MRGDHMCTVIWIQYPIKEWHKQLHMDTSFLKLIFCHCGSFVQYQLYRCTGVQVYRSWGSAWVSWHLSWDNSNRWSQQNICNQSRLNHVPPLSVDKMIGGTSSPLGELIRLLGSNLILAHYYTLKTVYKCTT